MSTPTPWWRFWHPYSGFWGGATFAFVLMGVAAITLYFEYRS